MEEIKLKSILNTLVLAGEAIIDIYNNRNFETELKSDNSPVTKADKTSSKIINRGLGGLFPQIPIIDEENLIVDYEERKNWSNYFLLDPLDGTKEFIKQNGEFCINLALIAGDKPVEGWIYKPITQNGWYCKKGQGIFSFDKSLKTKHVKLSKLKNKKIRIVVSRSFFKPREAKIIKRIEAFYPVEVIHKGSSIKHLALILGDADMYLKAGPCSEWDTAPGQLMIEESGGAVLQLQNFKPLAYNKPKTINPPFVMLSSAYNNSEFITFLKERLTTVKN